MAKAGKKRADILVVEQGLTRSREEARRSIMAGLVHTDNRRVEKPGELLPEATVLHLKEKLHPFVGRGGLKLQQALNVFKIDVKGRVCADFGSSTGGFTDCLLQRGAKKVFAIDAGTNQLDYRLRQDERVVVMENFNARFLKPEDLKEPVSFICMDVSFISVKKLIPVFPGIVDKAQVFDAVILVKPQFEVGRNEVEKHGIIKDKRKHARVLGELMDFAVDSGFMPTGLCRSPITGQKGNVEYLLRLQKQEAGATLNDVKNRIEQVVMNG
ncbi:MAG: TlyA family RNA methyltransferase [Acidobacteria bacterium]|nr:MAG: TlyA family RNA methyltransferase [Acidobacteriota bacterium]